MSASSRSPWRRGALAGILVAVLAAIAFDSSAQSFSVPIDLQADLLKKIVDYDRSMPKRAAGRVKTLLYTKADNNESAYVATQMRAALGRKSDLAGLPHDEVVLTYTGPAALLASCNAEHASIVFFGPGFGADVKDIGASLSGISVMSVSALPDYVPDGIVLGFDSVSGKPTLVVNLSQAKKQDVNFSPNLLRLAKVYQ